MAPDEAVDGLVCAYLLDGEGGGRALDWAGVEAWTPADGLLWVHLDRMAAHAQTWLVERSGLPPLVADAMLDEETRPRSQAFEGGALAILRGVNLNPGADPEDMISIRAWFEDKRIVTTRRYRIMAIQDLRNAIEAGHGPQRKSAFLTALVDRLTDRIQPVVETLSDRVDGFEEQLLSDGPDPERRALVDVRHEAIVLRRYLAPQRDAVARLATEHFKWISAEARLALREQADRMLRLIEDLDAMRERTAVVQDEMMNRISERMNSTMYLLTIVAAIMLPLGVITGLLGINVGGIPGADSPFGFATVVGLLVALVAVQVWLFRRAGWF